MRNKNVHSFVYLWGISGTQLTTQSVEEENVNMSIVLTLIYQQFPRLCFLEIPSRPAENSARDSVYPT